MFLENAIFYQATNKIPNLKIALTYDQVKEFLGQDEFAIKLEDIICIDIDDANARKLLDKAQDKGLLNKLVYTYKPLTSSYHFFFKKSNKVKNLKNKNNYRSIANIEFEYLDNIVNISDSDTQYINFNNDLSELDIIFYPALNLNGKWNLFNNVNEKLDALMNASEGDKRSLNLFTITSNLLKISQSQFIFTKEEYTFLYDFYNEVILNEPLTNSEVANNISQIFNDNSNNILTSEFSDCVVSTKKGVLFNDILFAKKLVEKYNIINFNSQIYCFYDNKYLILNKEYKEISNLLYFLIDKEINTLNTILGTDAIKLTFTRYSEIEKQITFNAIFKSTNDTNENVFRVANGIIVWNEAKQDFELQYGLNQDWATFTDIEINYNPTILTNSKIDNFLKQIFYRKDEKEMNALINVFWEMLGCVLVDNNNNRSAFLFKGYKGKNGKSTLLQFIARFIGAKNISSLKYEQLTSDGFALSTLRNKKVNLTDEMPSMFDANNGTLKSLISGGTISTDIKFQPISQWKNFATLIFASNYNLKVIKFNQAISDRLYIIELKNRFDGASDVKNIEKQLLSNPEDWQYTLNKAIEGLKRLILNNYVFTKSQDNFKNRLEMILDNEPIKNWLYNTNQLEDIVFNQNEDFIVNDSFKILIQTKDVKELLELFKAWYEEYYGKDCGYGIATFKEKLFELGLEISRDIRNNNKEYVKVVEQ